MEPGNVVTPWAFRDGREYIVSLSVNEKPKSVCVLIKDKITAEEWRCHYDLKYIEDLTQRTGNFKQFDVFVSMIKCAILKNTDSVTLELLSLEDLKTLKNKRHRHGLVATNETNKGHFTNHTDGSQEQSATSTKKYLIVTYTSEFDTVHYPIALNYSGPPDPLIMQTTIRRLMGEVSHLRTANAELSSQLKSGPKLSRTQTKDLINIQRGLSSDFGLLGDDEDRAGKVGDPGQTATQGQGHTCNPQQSESHFDIQSMQKLLCSIHLLEEKIVRERVQHLGEMEKLMLENNFLQKKLDKLQNSEFELKHRLEHLEGIFDKTGRREVSRFQNTNTAHTAKDRDRNNNTTRNPSPGIQRYQLRRSSSNTADSRLSGDHDFQNQTRVRANSVGSTSSEPIMTGRQRTTTTQCRRSLRPEVIALRNTTFRSRSVSPRFDPTAYVRERKEREDKIRQVRMSKIESRFMTGEGSRGRPRRRNDRSEDEQTSTSYDRRSNNSTTLTSLEARDRQRGCFGDRSQRPRPRQPPSFSPVGRSTRVTYSRSPRLKRRTEDVMPVRITGQRRRPAHVTVSARSAMTDLHKGKDTFPLKRGGLNRLSTHGLKVLENVPKNGGQLAPEDFQPKGVTKQKTSVDELEGPLKAIQAFIDATKATLFNTGDYIAN